MAAHSERPARCQAAKGHAQGGEEAGRHGRPATICFELGRGRIVCPEVQPPRCPRVVPHHPQR